MAGTSFLSLLRPSPFTSQLFPSFIKYPFLSPLLPLHSPPTSSTPLSNHSSQHKHDLRRSLIPCFVFSSSIPGDRPTLEPEDGNLDPETQEALLRGGEQVTSVLEQMIKLLEDMEMDEASEAVAVEIAAQGVIGKRIDEMESGFIMALDYMIQLAAKDNDDKRKSLLEILKQTVLDHLTKKCPPHVQVIGLLCRTPLKESRHELLRRVAGGGGVFKGENDLKVHLPGANLNDIANQADDLLETMEARPTVPDRKLLARLVLIREEARNMMGGGILDERNDRGLSTLPEAEVNFLSKLVTLRPGKNVQIMIENVLHGKDEGADSTGVDTKDSGGQLGGITGRGSISGRKPRPVRPGMFLETVTKVLAQRAARSKDSAVDESLAPKAVGVEENGEKAEVRRNVNPLCGYASNPYHKCTDFCTRRNPNKKSSTKGASFILPFTSSERRKERVMTVSTNKVNPNCSYASNPYHQCTTHCSQRTKKISEIEQGKPGIAAIVSTERSSSGIGMTQRNNVDPRCKYASNPYHECSSFCSLKINKVA